MYVGPSIKKTPKIEKRPYQTFQTEDKIIEEIVNRFTYVLEQNISKENLQLFYNNLSSIKIKNKNVFLGFLSEIFKTNSVSGQYFLDDNSIRILPLITNNILSKFIGVGIENYTINLCHEFLHMSSTIVDKKTNIAFSGFSQIGTSSVGISLDEAYTEILLYRYFNFDKSLMSYKYEVEIVKLIDEIIGKDIMTNLYFNADLYNFIVHLQKYIEVEEILMFIQNLDSIFVLEDYGTRYKNNIIYYHNSVIAFLVKTYKNKLNIQLKEGQISYNEASIKVDYFINKINKCFVNLELEKSKVKKREIMTK